MTTINYTGRRRISRDRVQLRLKDNDGAVELDVDRVNLGGLSLSPDAEVVVEAYRQTTRQRVSCGTVGAPNFPSNVPLTEFDVGDGLLFRVKVVAVGDADGMLLASAERIPALEGEDAGGRKALLPFRPSGDLDQLLWKFEGGEEPMVLINERVGADWRSFALSPYFVALVYPEIMRQAALWVLLNKEDAEEHVGQPGAWRRFLAGLGKDPAADDWPDPESEEATLWADEVAHAFSRRHRLCDVIVPLFSDPEAAF